MLQIAIAFMCCCFGLAAITVAVTHSYRIVKELRSTQRGGKHSSGNKHVSPGDEYMLTKRAMDIMGPMMRK